MPEKSLPFFRRNPQNQPQEATPNFSPNLVVQEEILPPNFYYLNIASKFFRRFSLIIILVFGAMLLINVFLNLKLTSQQKMINQAAYEASKYIEVTKQAKALNLKTNFYQRTLSQRTVLGEKAYELFSNLGPEVHLTALVFGSSDFRMDVEVATPLEFAKLMNRLLSGNHISSITLQGADLVVSKNYYRVRLEGQFK